MKIAMFSDTYFPQINGVTSTVSLWKKRLEKRGHVVKLFFPNSSYNEGKNEFPVRSFPFPFYDGYRIALPERLENHLKGVDIIHTHTPFSMGILGGYYSKKLNKPRISTFHTPPEDFIEYLPGSSILKSPLISLYQLWERKFFNSAEFATAPSNFRKSRLEKKGIKEIYLLENGVDTDFFSPDSKKFRKKFDSKHLIGYTGRHSIEKKLEDLIKVSKRLDDVEVLISGDGPFRKKYEKMASDRDEIHFTGFLEKEKLPSFYSSLDAFVLPSTSESQGLVALEANACGTPVVSSYNEALDETVKEGLNGFKYELGNISELENKIKKALKNTESFRDKCINYAEKHSAEKTIDKLINFYKRVRAKNEAEKLYN